MRTFTKFRKDIASYSNVSTSDTIEMEKIDGYLNDSIRTICNQHGGKLRFLEATKDMVTVADQQTYQIPNGFRKIMDLYIYDGAGAVGDTIYTPRMIYDPKIWKHVLQGKLGTSEVPYLTYIENTQFKVEPVPSVSGNKITLRGRLKVRDLTIADYVTGTITTIANNTTTVTGSGTTWTASMKGRYINFDEASGGDGFWYKIDSVTNGTTLELLKPYEGTSIASGTATFTIGQSSVIPSAYDVGVVYRSTALYWTNQKDLERARTYWLLYDGGKEAGLSKDYGGLMSEMIVNEGETEEGAYIPPLGTLNPYNDYYYPRQQATGF